MYLAASQDAKKEATGFLEEFQKSQHAWELAHQILQNSQNLGPFRLFAAQTLRSKVTYDLVQLPETAWAALKDLLLDLLALFTGPQDKILRTPLAVALAQLALQNLLWHGAVHEAMAKMQQGASLACLLDFLRVLPEELSDAKKLLLTDEEFNARTNELISANVEPVLALLSSLAQKSTENAALTPRVLECLNLWIAECPIEDILKVAPLTALVFQSLTNDDTFDGAIDCLCTILRETRDIDNYVLIDALYQQVVELHTYMAAHPHKLEDPDTFGGLTRLYVEAGESWHVLVAKNPAHFRPLVDILVECCRYDDDLDVVKYTFYFWNMLKQLLTLPRFQDARAALQEPYMELIRVIIRHLTYPINADDDNLFGGDKEQEDKFKEFRYEMGDVLKDCCAVVGATRALEVPFQQIQSIISSSAGKWQHLEAPLFLMRAMAKEVPLKEKTILPTIMEHLVELPEHPKVRYAATLVLGRYTEWTLKNPTFLEPQLTYITKGFEASASGKETVVAATHALMYFCQDCAPLLVNYLEQLYLLYGQVLDRLDIESTYELVDGLAHVLKQLPDEQLYDTILMFWKPTLASLHKLAEGPAGEPTNVAIADQLEVLTTYVGILRCKDFDKPDSPVARLFVDKVWPVASQILHKYGQSLKVSERVLKLIKAAVQSFSTYLNGILGDLARLLHDGFHQTTYGCYLWVSGVVIREFGDEYSSEEIKESIYQFGLLQTASFYELLHNGSDIKAMPDVIEDFFRMMNDLLMYYPFKLIPNGDLLKLSVEASVLTLTNIVEIEPLVSCLHYLVDLVLWGLPYPPVSLFDENPQEIQDAVKRFLIDGNGQKLVLVLVEGLIFKFHNDIQQDANDLLLKVLTVVPDASLTISWLATAANGLPNVNGREVEKLVTTISVALPNKDNRRVRSSIKDFVSWYSRKNVSLRLEF